MPANRLNTIGGEFSSPEREAAFQAERFPETMRHARLLFAASFILNLVFLISDWRFAGQPHFWVAVPARLAIVAVSLGCLSIVHRAKDFPALQRILLAWEGTTLIGVALLCTSRSEIALLAMLIVPGIYILAVPTSFRWASSVGLLSAIVLTAVYLLPPPLSGTAFGLVLVVCVMTLSNLLIVVRGNRGRRLEWSAIQAARRANAELAESRRLFETMFRAVPVPIVVSNQADGRMISANDAALRFFDIADTRRLTQHRTGDLVGRSERRQIQSELEGQGFIRDVEIAVRTLTGEHRDILLSAANVEVDGAPCIISSLVDITNRKAVEERIRLAALHDTLTGLPNRALFQSTLDAALAAAEASGARVGLIVLDLDAFKEVNDTLGHEAGDALLKEVGRRLASVLQPGDLVARLGGDEFVFIAACEASAGEPARRIHALADTILAALNPPSRIAGRIVVPRASLGLALFPEHAGNAADLFTNADLALYAAKAAGRNRATLFVPSLRANIEARVAIIREMHVALEQGGLVPFYQPKVRLATGDVVGFEALARWQHPTRGLLAPAAFSNVFDDPETGIAVGRCLMRQIFADVAGWVGLGLEPGRVFLNLSSAQFAQNDLAETILAEIARANLSHDRIGVEVTETVLLGGHGDRVAPVLEILHGAGIRVALDDFGTGYASLTHLKQYPVDEIKVDRSFVRDLERDADDAAIVTAVLQLGRSLGLDVTAEGVETPAQARFLEAQGCAFAQGYLYSKPMPHSRVAWFLEHRPDRAFDPSLPTGALKIA